MMTNRCYLQSYPSTSGTSKTWTVFKTWLIKLAKIYDQNITKSSKVCTLNQVTFILIASCTKKKKRPSFSEWRKLRNVSTVSRQPESTYHPHKHYIEYWQLWSGVQGCQIAATGRSHSTANISEYEQFSNLIKMSCFDNWLTFKKYGQKSGRFNWECFLFWGW